MVVHGRPNEVGSDLRGQPTFTDNFGKADTLNWEQVKNEKLNEERPGSLSPQGVSGGASPPRPG